MKKLTLKKINSELKKLNLNCELVKGKGYFYFIGDDVAFTYSSSVCVYKLNHLSLEQWINEAKDKVEESKKREI